MVLNFSTLVSDNVVQISIIDCCNINTKLSNFFETNFVIGEILVDDGVDALSFWEFGDDVKGIWK